MIASLILIFASSRWVGIATFQQFLARVVWPIQNTIDMPVNLFEQTQMFFSERLNLLEENSNLRQQHIYLQAQVQKLRALEAENQELRELLQSVGKEKESFFEARLIHADIDPFSHQILLNKGKAEGVVVGQPVIDANGLVGIALAVNEHISRVLLLTDAGFAVPVQSVRSGERAIATGSGTGGEVRLNYVPRTADFVEGDQLVTSGLGGRFPVGYPVGVITSIQHDPSTRFTLIGVSPSAKLGQLRHVLFVKHNKVTFPILNAESNQDKPDLLQQAIQDQQAQQMQQVPQLQQTQIEPKDQIEQAKEEPKIPAKEAVSLSTDQDLPPPDELEE